MNILEKTTEVINGKVTVDSEFENCLEKLITISLT
jgi:hypothetical protein